MPESIDPAAPYSLLGKVEGAEKLFLSGRRDRADARGPVRGDARQPNRAAVRSVSENSHARPPSTPGRAAVMHPRL